MNPNESSPPTRLRETLETDRSSTGWARDGATAPKPLIAQPMDIPAGLSRTAGPRKRPGEEEPVAQSAQRPEPAAAAAAPPAAPAAVTAGNGLNFFEPQASAERPAPASSGALADRPGDAASTAWARDPGPRDADSTLGGWLGLDTGYLGMLGAGGLLAARGGSSSVAAAPTASGPAPLQIMVQDGPIANATVYVDTNGDGVLAQSEKIGQTNAQGVLVYSAALPAGNLVVTGGTNIDTGLPNTQQLVVAAGAIGNGGKVVINPLTTLVAEVYAQSNQPGEAPITLAAAEDAVKAALGLPAGLALAQYDPLEAGAAGSALALAVQRQAALVASLPASAAVDATVTGGIGALAVWILDHPGVRADLASLDTLTQIFAGLADAPSPAELAELAVENLAIATADSITAISQAQKAAAAPSGLRLQFDTGSDSNDRITIDPRLAVTGMKASAKLQVSVDGGGNWVDASAFNPGDGTWTAIARLAFANGFVSQATEPFEFVLDAQAPATPSLALTNDTGSSAADAITSDARVTVGPAAEGASLEFSTDQITWSPTLPAAREGANTLYARQSFALTGATSATTQLVFQLKTTAVTGTAGLAGNTESVTYDTGISGTDSITAYIETDGEAPLKLTGTTGAGNTQLTITIADRSYTLAAADIDSEGRWSLELAAPLPEGRYDVVVQARDVAGNLSAPTVAGTVVIDTTAPSAGSAGLSGGIAGQVGETLTNNTQPVLTGRAEPGSSVEVDVNGTIYATITRADGTWSLTVGEPLPDGDYTPTLVVTDAAGNAGEAIDGLAFTVMATPPEETEQAMLVQEEEFDTGIASDDGITSNNLPLITGAVDRGMVAVVVRLGSSVYVTQSDDDGAWSVQVEGDGLPDGTYIPRITYMDAAGNLVKTDGLPIVIDTTAPDTSDSEVFTAELVHDAVNDTGASETDGITANTSPTLAGTSEAFSHISVDINGEVFETDADESGRWTVDLELPDNGSTDEYTPIITVTDRAGNVSEAYDGTPFTVDTAEPEPAEGGLVHDDVNDTGLDIEDNLTNNARPAFAGTAGPGSLVTLEIAGLSFTGATDSEGNWTIEPDQDIPDGTYTPVATVTSPSGAQASTDFEEITIDTRAPDALDVYGSLTPDEDNDTGVSPADGITSNPSPLISGVAPASAQVEIELVESGQGTLLTLLVDADEDGNWSATPDVELPDGRYVPMMYVVDAAGNRSEGIAGEPFVIDTSAPSDPTGGLLQDAANDTGASAEDNITNNPRPTITGTADPRCVIVVALGGEEFTTVSDDLGNWSIVPSADLEDGEYTLTVTATTLAGVAGDPVELDPVTIVTSFEEEPTGGLTHDEDSDTGADSEDSITANTTPQLSGTAPAGAQVVVTVGGQLLAAVLADDDGAWSVDVAEPLADGPYVPKISVTDLAGNTVEFDGEPFVVSTQVLLPGGMIGTHQLATVNEVVDIAPFPPGVDAAIGVVSDYSGSLPAGLEIDDATQHIVGKATDAGFTWIAIEASDAAGNTATQYFQMAVTAQVKLATASAWSVYNLAPETASTYVGSDIAESVSVYYSNGDVILADGGNDIIRLYREEAKGFARLDGGDGDDKLMVYGTGISLDFSEYNNPDGNGQVIQGVETIFFAGTASSINITAQDIFNLQSDVLVMEENGLHSVVRLQANSINRGTVNIADMQQVGDVGQFGADGGASSGLSSDRYTKFVGTVTDSAGDHLVELLIQNGLTGVVS